MAACNRCENGLTEDGQLCHDCCGTGFIRDDDDCGYTEPDTYESIEDDFQPCDKCDLPDACEDFGCAIKAGLYRPIDDII